LHVIADAHFLPFKGDCFDIVYSIAVLEHVQKPWVVADEICRVLRQGGHVVVELPFLNVIHDQHDYFRFTDKGIRSLFDESRFDSILEQVSAGGGSFLSVFLLEYFQQFVPKKVLKTFWRLAGRYLFSLLKYLDLAIDSSKELRRTANSFSFIGRKR
jgi:ubiquinone/menaquinone biosynthesis C-methylase UbiE